MEEQYLPLVPRMAQRVVAEEADPMEEMEQDGMDLPELLPQQDCTDAEVAANASTSPVVVIKLLTDLQEEPDLRLLDSTKRTTHEIIII